MPLAGEKVAYVVPRILLNNGLRMPQYGLGTWKSKPGKVKLSVTTAIDCGYRMIDCALEYENEFEIGEGLCEKYKEGAITRDRLFLTSKVWMTFLREDLVEEAFGMSTQDLQTDYIDLYLIHWPTAIKECSSLHPATKEGKWIYSTSHFSDTWKVMEKLYKAGKAKAIGVCNFNKRQLTKLFEGAKIRPVVDQVECHPFNNQAKLKAFVEPHMMYIMAFSPLGSNDRPWRKSTDPVVLEDPTLKKIAEVHGKSAAAVCLRYQLQRGNITMSKSVTPKRIEENFMLPFGFSLTEDEMKQIDGLNKNVRYVALEWIKDHPEYPFTDEY